MMRCRNYATSDNSSIAEHQESPTNPVLPIVILWVLMLRTAADSGIYQSIHSPIDIAQRNYIEMRREELDWQHSITSDNNRNKFDEDRRLDLIRPSIKP